MRPEDINSDDVEANESIIVPDDSDQSSGQFPSMILAVDQGGTSGMQTGDDIPSVEADGNPDDGEHASRSSSSRRTSGGRQRESTFRAEATSRPPSLDEWTGFFSRIVLRFITEWYLSFAFRGIDEDALTERELDRLLLSDDEKRQIAIPFAELSNRSKFMRKHGRTIVSSGDSFNALVILGMWFSRVNRIASKYRPRVVRGKTMNGAQPNVDNRQTTAPPNDPFTGTSGGRVPNGFPIFPGTS